MPERPIRDPKRLEEFMPIKFTFTIKILAEAARMNVAGEDAAIFMAFS